LQPRDTYRVPSAIDSGKADFPEHLDKIQRPKPFDMVCGAMSLIVIFGSRLLAMGEMQWDEVLQ
jgi:hypothetical protein